LAVQLENLQVVANNATMVVNARGPLLVNRLQNIPVHAREIALHGVCRGATIALATAQV
jgi:hypothetical protein